jgi:hypothetical protein
MTQPGSITCRSCRTWIEDRGRGRRCPNCGAQLDTAPLPDLPRGIVAGSEELQEPAFPQDPRARGDDTAPLSEFAAAGAVLGGLVLIVLGAVVQSGTVALVGVVLMFGVTGFFAIAKGSLGRAITHYRTTMWGGLRRQYHEKSEYDREQDRR